MLNCIEEKLKESVENPNLLLPGEVSIDITSKSNKHDSKVTISEMFVILSTLKDITLKVTGDLNFVDENGNVLGKTITKSKHSSGAYYPVPNDYFYLSDGEGQLIFNKYEVTKFIVRSNRVSIPLEYFEYSSFDGGSIVLSFGDISSLKKYKNIKNNPYLSLMLQQSYEKSIYGDITCLADDSIVFGTPDKQVSTPINIMGLDKLYGDLSNINSCGIDNTYGSCEFSWEGTRPSNYPIMSMAQIHLKNIDNMLINQADCTSLDVSYKSVYPWLFVISVLGERTTASNEAIKTLNSKGYTVVLNNLEVILS